ncbi:DNA polymerase III subunit beta [Paenibacillus spongiae]|uniref:Beta sliding clamp n=1 Tax=Paenibacillus spongiae TaxID=2909671 RepID=A0ABY5S998_9BACL|nr:DNA polymerase III subunit beta [Paenibacillus spongiae]UVI30497.1 DNA polymerase III subunit beta [Paenibacillus spongiae]
MRISVSRETLYAAVQNVMKAVSSTCTIPILSGIKLTAHSNGLTLIASHMHMMIRHDIPLTDTEGIIAIHSTGCIVVPAKTFSDILRKFPSDQVKLDIAEHLVLTIRADSSVYRLCGMDPSDFPDMPEARADLLFNIPSPLLYRVIKQVAFAVSSSENRPVLTGVSCRLDAQGRLRFLAADGVRLAVRTIDLDISPVPVIHPIIIPGSNLLELAKLLRDEQGTTEIAFGESWAVFKTGHTMVYSALIDGTYPNVEHLIPISHTTELLVHSDAMIQAIERVMLLTDESQLLRFHAAGHHIKLTARTAQVGDVIEELNLANRTGADIELAFNGKHMRDILRSADSERTTLKFTGKLNPIVIEPSADPQSTYILTPIRT